MLTFFDLKEWAKSRAKDSKSVCTDEKLQMWAELLAQDIVIRTGGKWLYDEYTFTSTTDVGEYALPSRYWKSLRMVDVTNQRPIDRVDVKAEDNNIDRSSATPWAYTPIYVNGVAAQPETAGTVTIESSDADDNSTNGDVFILKGRYGNVEVGESINMNGTTPVSSTNSYTHIWSASKGGTRTANGTSRYSTDGSYTLKDSGSNTLLSLGTEDDSLQYQWIRFLNTPDEAVSYRLHFIRKVKGMHRNYDVMDIPYGFENAALLGMEWYVKWFLYDRRDDAIFARYVDEAERALEFGAKHDDERIVHMEIEQSQGLYVTPLYVNRRA